MPPYCAAHTSLSHNLKLIIQTSVRRQTSLSARTECAFVTFINGKKERICFSFLCIYISVYINTTILFLTVDTYVGNVFYLHK